MKKSHKVEYLLYDQFTIIHLELTQYTVHDDCKYTTKQLLDVYKMGTWLQAAMVIVEGLAYVGYTVYNVMGCMLPQLPEKGSRMNMPVDVFIV